MAAAISPGWLDSLSEEWISEPRDPNSSPLSNKTGESVHIHGAPATDANASGSEQNHEQASRADELPSTMCVQCGLEIPPRLDDRWVGLFTDAITTL